MHMAAKKSKTLSFEEGLERLETIAGDMEKGELALDELLKLYEEGMKLSAELNRKLEAAESRMMEIKMGRDGEAVAAESDVAQQQTLLDGLMDE